MVQVWGLVKRMLLVVVVVLGVVGVIIVVVMREGRLRDGK
jgi:heme/copper-type cytochrome/quinol oxidase subunit 2